MNSNATTAGGQRDFRWVRDRRSAWIAAVLFAALVALIIPPDLLQPGTDGAFGTPHPTLRLIKYLLLGLGGLMVLSRARMAWLLLKSFNPFFSAFLVLMPVSLLWSISPLDTLLRYAYFLTIVVVCTACALVGWHRQHLPRIVRVVVTLFVLGSLCLGFFAPDLVMEQGDSLSLRNAWHGLASQKNDFGQVASFGVILWFHAWMYGESKRLYTATLGGVALVCLLLSRSSTSMLSTGVVMALMLLLQRAPPSIRRYIPYIIVLFAAVILVYAIGVLNLVPGLGALIKPFSALVGKDATFSNRSIIWDILEEHIRLSPILGSGYGAYWIGDVPTSPSSIFPSRMYMYPTEAHNGYLEIVNDLGFVGLLCLVGFLEIGRAHV